MRKLLSLVFAAAMFTFVACEQKTETVSEETTTTPTEEVMPAEDPAVEPMEETADTTASIEGAVEEGAADTTEAVQE